ncbi:Protein UBASH3A-like [Gracilariopsis chorda]|uniref:Protein UBASH3A-like n=1 Tax=Gracilariopsis chorda TaxID=448386 RepID=A0A2V3J1U8_9FLOR|nr:Protein UBASH3A-like [Gracilariopsis chorda]|eukprot:PXF47947.1 Protein UBASH3A-like [Gracilariopsis chorda]
MDSAQSNAPTIFLARHGERLDFVDPTWHITAERPDDAPLTRNGVSQAHALGAALADRNITHIFASPFQRSLQTASHASSQLTRPVRLNVEPGLCEWLNEAWYAHSVNGPKWLQSNQIHAQFPIINTDYQPVYPFSWNIDGYPELYHHLQQRCSRTVATIIDTVQRATPNQQANILLVGHGSSLRALHTELLPNIPPITIGYCALTECIATPQATIKYRLGSFHCDQTFLP